jgi:hypothetical protein
MKFEDGYRAEESLELILDVIWIGISHPDMLGRANGSSTTRSLLPGTRLGKALACG